MRRLTQPHGSPDFPVRFNQTVPRDERLRPNNVEACVKGKRGAELKTVVGRQFPAHLQAIGEAKTQRAVKEAVAAIVDGLPESELTRAPCSLPSGIPNSVRALFPETAYIPAVTDPRDELRNKATTTFGRLLGIVLRLLEQDEQLSEIEVALGRLTRLLNRIHDEDGKEVDGRIQQIQDIEALLQGYVSETFPGTRRIEISVPRPDLKTLFDNANVQIDDGVLGDVNSKGDGMKRALVFALLRTYVVMKAKLARADGGDSAKPKDRPYLFLFEEPELYLHPQAQLILFAALKNLSKVSQVLVTTHSPQFLAPNETEAFVRLKKVAGGESEPPYAEAHPVDLRRIPDRDLFQLICFEHNSAAFFADRVLLCEGDADLVYLSHLAELLIDVDATALAGLQIVPIGGKGNYRRFADFFRRFSVDVFAVLDRDALLGGFNSLGLPSSTAAVRESFLAELDQLVHDTPPLKGRKAKDLLKSRSWAERHEECVKIAARWAAGDEPTDDERHRFEILGSDLSGNARRALLDQLEAPPETMYALLSAMRAEQVFVLSQGAIEAYYPSSASGGEKPTRAIDACAHVRSRDEALAICSSIRIDDEREVPELEFYLRTAAGIVESPS